jgi:hypothetical protein
MNVVPFDLLKAPFWSAVINDVIAVPIMVIMTLVATRRQVMGEFVLLPRCALWGGSPLRPWPPRRWSCSEAGSFEGRPPCRASVHATRA